MRMRWVATGALVLFTGSVAWAQAPGPHGGRPAAGEARDEAYKMIDAYIVSNLQESLGLTDEQFVKMLPLVKRLQSDRRDLAQRRIRALMQLREQMSAGAATEAQVAALLKDVKAAEAEEPATLRRDRDAIDGALTTVQQAKFRVMEVEVERRIRALMTQVRQQRRGNGKGAPAAQP
jgi:hypothetical protein